MVGYPDLPEDYCEGGVEVGFSVFWSSKGSCIRDLRKLGRIISAVYRRGGRVKISLGNLPRFWQGELTVALPPENLKVLHFSRGPISVYQTPHYKSVVSLLSPVESQEHPLSAWREYKRIQHPDWSDSLFEEKEKRFVSLIRFVERGEQLTPLSVRFAGTGFLVTDGMHRLAALAGVASRRQAVCAIKYRKKPLSLRSPSKPSPHTE